jgi:rhodanese-related sulfurtransferase
MNLAIDEIEAKLPELATFRRPVIVYDRSYGDDAKKALEVFAAHQFPAAGLEGGILAWEGEGYEIERSN